MATDAVQKIVILGAGVATFRLIRELVTRGHGLFAITLIDTEAAWPWPESPSVAFTRADQPPAMVRITRILEGMPVAFIQALVDRIDPHRRLVYLHDHDEPVPFDDLIIGSSRSVEPKGALGDRTHFSLTTEGLFRLREYLDDLTALVAGKSAANHRDLSERIIIVGESREAWAAAVVIGRYRFDQLRRFGQSLVSAIELAVTPAVLAGMTPTVTSLLKRRLAEYAVVITTLPDTYRRLSKRELSALIGPPEHKAARTIVVLPPVFADRWDRSLAHFPQDQSGRLVVTPNLLVHGSDHLWVIGPRAATFEETGLTNQIAQADCLADNLLARQLGHKLVVYELAEKRPIIYLGGHQSLLEFGGVAVYGIGVDSYRRLRTWLAFLRIFPWYRLGRLVMFGQRYPA